MAHTSNSEYEQLTSRELLEQRDEIVQSTGEWVGRATMLMNSIRAEFPNTECTLLSRFGRRTLNELSSTEITSPRIVMSPRSLYSDGNYLRPVVVPQPFERYSAASLQFTYQHPTAIDLDRLALEGDFPEPNVVRVQPVLPIAIQTDWSHGRSMAYQGDNPCSISGHVLDMLRWTDETHFAVLPFRWDVTQGEQELIDFDVFREYPAEAIVRYPEAIAFHREKLETFQASIGEVALAVSDPSLNPRW